MAVRYVVWHAPIPGSPLPRFYVDADSEPVALRLYADIAPGGGDMVVDILDDGTSIMNSNNYQKRSFTSSDGYLELHTSGTFTVKETVTGGTSSTTAKVKKVKVGGLILEDASGVFTVGETVTGLSSLATGVVDAHVREIKSSGITTVTGQSHANLPKGKNANDAAQDFKPSVYISEGSWLSCNILEANGAANVTVQLELNPLAGSVESRPWAE